MNTKFPISYWLGPAEFSPEEFDKIAAAGFNVVVAPWDRPRNLQVLDWAAGRGMKAMVADYRTNPAFLATQAPLDRVTALDGLVSAYGGHAALWGYLVADEPSPERFPLLSEINEHLRQKNPKASLYMNLFPNWVPSAQIGGLDYAAYVVEFMEQVWPRWFSFDNYEVVTARKETYFWNFEVIRNAALRYGVPFASIAMAVPPAGYREPTPAEIRLQVNTALCYGAKGLFWWTWAGLTGAALEEVTIINDEVQKLAPTLLRLHSVGVYHTDPVPIGATRLPEGRLISTIEGEGFIIGEFSSTAGERFAIFVNRGRDALIRVLTVRFSRPVRLWLVNPTTGRQGEMKLSMPVWDCPFAPGEARLVRIQTV